MTDRYIWELDETTTLTNTDVFPVGTNQTTTPETNHVTFENLVTEVQSNLSSELMDWIPLPGTWTFSSVDSPTGVVSVNADVTGILSRGMRFKYNQDQTMSAYWTFNTNSTADVGFFSMGNIGSPTYSAGKFGNALTLNGSTDALSIVDTATLKPTGDFTVGAWFKSSVGATTQTIFQSYSQNTNMAGVQLLISSGTSSAYVRIGNNTSGTPGAGGNSDFAAKTVITDGNWHYVVYTQKNNWGQLYLDGVLEASGYALTPAYAATNYIRIGSANAAGTNSAFFNGQIDDLFVINGYAIDGNYIRDKYLAGTAQGTSSLTLDKMGIITNVGAYSGGNTLVTIYGGTDFLLANATVSNPAYSSHKVPYKFPLNPDKWTVMITDSTLRSQASPTQDVWYNLGSLSITIPIGMWNVTVQQAAYAAKSTATSVNVFMTFSTANNSESDPDMTAYVAVAAGTATLTAAGTLHRTKTYSLSAKTTYYLNAKTSVASANSVAFDNASSRMITRAVCAYL